jgi:hypothetical protein
VQKESERERKGGKEARKKNEEKEEMNLSVC